MSGAQWQGLAVLAVFLGLLLLFAGLGRRRPAAFRPIPAFQALGLAIERAVEAGQRVHISLGTGSIVGQESAPAFAGLAALSRVARTTSMSDRPVVATTGDAATAILARDTLRNAYQAVGAAELYEPTAGRLLAPTPFSYVAGLPLVLATEEVAVHILTGSFGVEAALAADFGERENAFVIAGTDDVQSQALFFATAEHPLIGEEVFATGAYLEVGGLHPASLRAQDAVRWGIILLILGGTLLSTFGELL
jgi:hypothetical protein